MHVTYLGPDGEDGGDRPALDEVEKAVTALAKELYFAMERADPDGFNWDKSLDENWGCLSSLDREFYCDFVHALLSCKEDIRIALGDRASETEITMDMIGEGVSAFRDYDPEVDEPEALIFAILYRAMGVKRSRLSALADKASMAKGELAEQLKRLGTDNRYSDEWFGNFVRSRLAAILSALSKRPDEAATFAEIETVALVIDEAELKSCPFCGGEVELHKVAEMKGGYSYHPGCHACDFSLEARSTEAEAIAAWNRRDKPCL